MNAIFQRRSIRKYTQDEVSETMIQQVLEAAMSAPSAANERPWQFVVVTQQEILTKLAGVSPYAGMTANAPVAIIVCGDLKRETVRGFWVQDCSAATENLLIEAEDLHLGAVWLGIYPLEDRMTYLRNVLNLPEHIVPFAMIPVGHPAETKTTPSRYDQSRVHSNTW